MSSSRVDGVIVDMAGDPAESIDVLSGRVEPVGVRLIAISEVDAVARPELNDMLSEILNSNEFKTFGLDLTFDVLPAASISNDLSLSEANGTSELFEFDVSRHGAFTQRPEVGSFPSLSSLLATFELGAPLHPTVASPLNQARAEGEKKLIQTLLSSGLTLDAIAEQFRLPRVEVERLLKRHGLATAAPAFAVPLPADLAARAERQEPDPS